MHTHIVRQECASEKAAERLKKIAKLKKKDKKASDVRSTLIALGSESGDSITFFWRIVRCQVHRVDARIGQHRTRIAQPVGRPCYRTA